MKRSPDSSMEPLYSSMSFSDDSMQSFPVRHRAFETQHPVLAFVYLCGVLILSACAIHPVLVALSLLGALSASLLLKGSVNLLSSIRWQLPLAGLVALANPLFSASGSTLLFKLGPRAIYQESLLFGACMGLMLISVLNWLMVAQELLSADRLFSLFGARFPTLGLMLSMTGRLVPQLLKRGTELRAIQNLSSQQTPQSLRERVADTAQMSGVLMAWSLADSLEAADAMRARGWSATTSRTSFRPYRMKASDVLGFALICCLLVVTSLLSWLACSQYHFYPVASSLVLWWGYLPCAAYFFLAAILSLRERMLWA